MQGGEIVMENNSKSKITPYLYLVPCMLIFGIFLFYPFVKTIYLSLYKTNKMGQAKLYVGLGNYKELLQSASFINSLKVTLIFVLIVVQQCFVTRRFRESGCSVHPMLCQWLLHPVLRQ